MTNLSRIVCMLAALFASSAAIASDTGWTISESDGQVSVARDDKAIYGAKGTRLLVGDEIRTSKAARAVLVRGDEFFVVSPNARVRIVKAKEDGTAAQVFEFLGSMLATDKQHSDFKRPMQAAVVKGIDHGLEEGESKQPDTEKSDSANPGD
ncbi:MAG: hypothetical protein AAGK02_16165 [Pseudomonadota bacterium]